MVAGARCGPAGVEFACHEAAVEVFVCEVLDDVADRLGRPYPISTWRATGEQLAKAAVADVGAVVLGEQPARLVHPGTQHSPVDGAVIGCPRRAAPASWPRRRGSSFPPHPPP